MRLVSEALSISYLFTWLFVVSTARDNLFIGELITISNGISKINLFRSIFKIYIFMATNWNERYDTLRAHFFANSFSNIDPECYAIQCNFPVRWENAPLHRRMIFFYRNSFYEKINPDLLKHSQRFVKILQYEVFISECSVEDLVVIAANE